MAQLSLLLRRELIQLNPPVVDVVATVYSKILSMRALPDSAVQSTKVLQEPILITDK